MATLLDFIHDEGSPVPDKIVAESSLTERIKGALKALTPREEEIIKMRFSARNLLIVLVGKRVILHFGQIALCFMRQLLLMVIEKCLG